MQRNILLLFTILSFSKINAQLEFTEHLIPHDNSSFAQMTYSDIDGDGDKDIITATVVAGLADVINWHENLDGLGNFSTERVINPDARGPGGLITGDFDGDGDMDFAAISFDVTDHIYWQANSDGVGTFNPKVIIDDQIQKPRDLFAADIDSDGDIDIVLVCGSDCCVTDNVILYKNDGAANFTKQVVSTSQHHTHVKVCDIDGDNDLDIVGSDFYGGSAYWYENLDGQGNFGAPNQFSGRSFITSSAYADLDNDNDMDLVISTMINEHMYWYENTDGLGSFTEHLVSLNRSDKVIAVDVNNDGRKDIVSQGVAEDIVWYENTGLGVFAEAQLIHGDLYDVRRIVATDFNGDGKIDIGAAATPGAVNLAWYKNGDLTSNKITGTITLDTNNNGCDSMDISASNVMVVADDGTNSIATFTLSNGKYVLYPPSGDHSISINSPLLNYYTNTPTSHNFNFSGIGNIVEGDFCLEPTNTSTDLAISLYPMTEARPGFNARYKAVYKNMSGGTIVSGNITFEYDNTKVQFLSSSDWVDSQTANSLSFYYPNLDPQETREIDLEFTILPPPTTNIGDILGFTTIIDPISVDINPTDNIATLNQTVIGSYDPNDIRVAEGEEILIDDVDKYLHYIIRFQNTGTASAINVSVDHILDDKLDWTTMQLEGFSHNGNVQITNGNQVEFIFNNIFLPDSTTDEPNSHGFIAFKIKPKSNAEVGDVINAEANIFFDFNPPIITNTVSTEIVEPLSVSEFHKNEIAMYPNPAKGLFTIRADREIEKLTIYDINGRQLKTIKAKETLREYKIELGDLSQGVYFIKIQTDSGIQTQKLIKE